MKLEVNPIQIRAHYETLSFMMRGLHESEKQLFNKTDDWDSIKEAYMGHVIEMQETANGTCLLAMVDDEPAGFIFGYEDEEDESRIEAYEGKDLYVSDGYIAPQYRRLGIYQKMNEMLEHIYIEQGVRRIIRFTLTSNKRMQHFLEGQHYQPVRLLYEKWLMPDGQTIDPLELTPGSE